MIDDKIDKDALLAITAEIAKVIEVDRHDRECCKQAIAEENEACAKICDIAAKWLQIQTADDKDGRIQWSVTAFKPVAELIHDRLKK